MKRAASMMLSLGGRIGIGLFVVTVLAGPCGLPGARGEPADRYSSAIERFAQAANTELNRGILPGLSVAWVVDGQLVHAAGFGRADWQRDTPASAETVYRAGSISKLFNAIAALQLVERDRLDLDAPIQRALPDFAIQIPFERTKPITIRQLLCHRSGMIREAPVGGYLDPSQPTIAATIRSVAACSLVNPPDTKTRYSNVGPTIVGRAVEMHGGLPYAEYQDQHVLGPLGMTSSAWTMNDSLRPRLAKGRMRVATGDGGYRFAVAPAFELGTIPAGNLYTTARDLARFAAFMMSGDASSQLSPPLVHPATLEMMVTPQLVDDETGFGLGFYVGRYRNHKTVQHSGAVYGFTTLLVVLPEERIGVAVLSNCDIGMGPVRKLGDSSLDLLLEAVRGEPMPPASAPVEVASDELARLTGHYESQSYWASLEVNDGSLVGTISGQPITLTPTSPGKFLADGRILDRSSVEFDLGAEGPARGFAALGQRFERVGANHPAEAPEAWKALLGTYGPEFIPLVISIRHGHLYATVENEYDYRLAPLNRVTFQLPPGMYADEQLVFQTDAGGKAIGAIMANQYLPRRD
jgi:CubicO group peptidase (beta-lactamase class C family)